jgi:excisionase family DNA binding protein
MKRYKLLDGRGVDLGRLGAPEQRFLRDLQRMARADVSYFEIYRLAVGPGSLAMGGANRIDGRIVGSPLYLAARDIATRAGIKQGLILDPGFEGERARAPGDASMMSVTQAAEFIGITRAAVYKAVRKGAIEATRIGNVTVVSRKSVLAYRSHRNVDADADVPASGGQPKRAASAHPHMVAAKSP